MNSRAALYPTYKGKKANSPQPIVRIDWYHHSKLYAFFVVTLITFEIPLINPAAIIPGNNGTKIFAMCSKKRWIGPLCFALFSFLFSFAKSAASTSSTLPNSIPVNSANSRPTSVTLPGPKTI